MAEIIYPGEYQDRPLHTFINDISLEGYSKQAESLLIKFPSLFVPRIQYKRSGVKNTCWYIALIEKPDIYIANFTIIPSNLHIEFRLARFFSVKNKHIEEFGMWYQVNWPTFGLKNIGQGIAAELLEEYVETVTPHVLNGTHRTVGRSSAEYLIHHDLKTIFPEHKVRHGERPILQPSGNYLELDLYIPKLNFAIEVQGPTHYAETDIYGNHKEVSIRDSFKKQWCQERGIKLMHIEWEGYIKTLYRLPENERQQKFRVLVNVFRESQDLFVEFREEDFRKFCSCTGP